MSVANFYQTQENLKLETSMWFQAKGLRQYFGALQQIEIKGLRIADCLNRKDNRLFCFA